MHKPIQGRDLGSGTYALLLECRQAGALRAGGLGRLHLDPGFYLYIGSAFGPGGLRSRLGRHAARVKKKHWHIDYLRPRTVLAGAWFSTSTTQLEHVWAARVAELSGAKVPFPGFGASDCRCASHLFVLQGAEDPYSSLSRALGRAGAGGEDFLAPGKLRALARGRGSPIRR